MSDEPSGHLQVGEIFGRYQIVRMLGEGGMGCVYEAIDLGLRAEGAPKILDFGVSKILDDANPALTGTMAVLGTASYMSPEQARGAKIVDAASDQYAIGLIFHEMLTATRGHDGDSPLAI